jgi:hypothetical protein
VFATSFVFRRNHTKSSYLQLDQLWPKSSAPEGRAVPHRLLVTAAARPVFDTRRRQRVIIFVRRPDFDAARRARELILRRPACRRAPRSIEAMRAVKPSLTA